MRLSSLLGATQKQEKQYTSNGTFIVPTGVTDVIVTMIGGGASGAAIASRYTTVVPKCYASGGTGGMTVFKLPVKLGGATTLDVVIGAGGDGVTVTDTTTDSTPTTSNGNNGGNSSIEAPYLNRTYVAYGGIAGTGTDSAAGAPATSQPYTQFAPYVILAGDGGRATSSGGTGGSPDILVSDGGGSGSTFDSSTTAGGGGASMFGAGGDGIADLAATVTGTQTGMDGYGGGSGGAAVRYNSGNCTATSADGKPGIVIIEWEGLPYGS